MNIWYEVRLDKSIKILLSNNHLVIISSHVFSLEMLNFFFSPNFTFFRYMEDTWYNTRMPLCIFDELKFPIHLTNIHIHWLIIEISSWVYTHFFLQIHWYMDICICMCVRACACFCIAPHVQHYFINSVYTHNTKASN